MPALQPEIVGETFDGIKILKPVAQPTSFSVAEIRKTVADVMHDHYERLNAERRTSPDGTGANIEADETSAL